MVTSQARGRHRARLKAASTLAGCLPGEATPPRRGGSTNSFGNFSRFLIIVIILALVYRPRRMLKKILGGERQGTAPSGHGLTRL
jgi:hypothetical protein